MGQQSVVQRLRKSLSAHVLCKSAAQFAQDSLVGLTVQDRLNKTRAFLTDVGLVEGQISNVVACFPKLLGYSIEDNLKPKVQWFEDLGLSDMHVAKVVASAPQ